MTIKRKINLFTAPHTGGGVYLYSTNKYSTLKEALKALEDRGRSVYVAGSGLHTVNRGVRVGASYEGSNTVRYSTGLDSRYSIKREYIGAAKKFYVVRFCGEYLFNELDKDTAYELAGAHEDKRQKALEGGQ